jgi:hypothetical protein
MAFSRFRVEIRDLMAMKNEETIDFNDYIFMVSKVIDGSVGSSLAGKATLQRNINEHP